MKIGEMDSLSGGKNSVILMIFGKSMILILDEPSSNLDSITKK